jgi:hypothetical protein
LESAKGGLDGDKRALVSMRSQSAARHRGRAAKGRARCLNGTANGVVLVGLHWLDLGAAPCVKNTNHVKNTNLFDFLQLYLNGSKRDLPLFL